MIEDKRLFEIIRGAEPTDSEIAEIVRSAVGHCRRTEDDDGSLNPITIRQGHQGSTWFEAFKALFKDMPNDFPKDPKEYDQFLVYSGEIEDNVFVGYAHDDDDGLGLKLDSDDFECEKEFGEHPEMFSVVPIVGLDYRNACNASKIMKEEEEEEE